MSNVKPKRKRFKNKLMKINESHELVNITSQNKFKFPESTKQGIKRSTLKDI